MTVYVVTYGAGGYAAPAAYVEQSGFLWLARVAAAAREAGRAVGENEYYVHVRVAQYSAALFGLDWGSFLAMAAAGRPLTMRRYRHPDRGGYSLLAPWLPEGVAT